MKSPAVLRIIGAVASLSVFAAPALAASAIIADIALSKPFGTRPAWRLIATQEPPSPDTFNPGETSPGSIHVCPTRTDISVCDPDEEATLNATDLAPHFLDTAQIVHADGRPLLLLRMASLPSGDGDQAVFTQLLAYRAASDRFRAVYAHMTGHNNSQEVRFIAAGPMAGSVVSAEPTADAPFGFWISVDKPGPDGHYKAVLKFRSATRYGDGNPLPVIDSEMANIGARLGFWRPGTRLPLPAGPCPRPRLVSSELWCQ